MNFVPWLIAGGLVFGLLGRWVADQCGRRGSEGFVLGFLFGPVGVIIEALLPHQSADDWRAKGWSGPAGAMPTQRERARIDRQLPSSLQ